MESVGIFFLLLQALKLDIAKVTLMSFKTASQNSLVAEEPPRLPVDVLLTLNSSFKKTSRWIALPVVEDTLTFSQA